MTKELLSTLSTGDKVANAKTGQTAMVGVLTLPLISMISIYDMNPPEDWELTKSRTTITQSELDAIAEYHKKQKEAAEGKKK